MTVHDRIRERRKELNLTADDLAVALNVSRATMFRYESAEIEKLPTKVIEPLCKILKVTPAYLMGWDVEKSENGITYISKERKSIIDALDYLSADDLKTVANLIDRLKK